MKVMKYTHYADGLFINQTWNALWKLFNDRVINISTRSHVYVVQTGSWNLAYTDFRTTIEKSLPELKKQLKLFNDEIQKIPGHRLLILGTPSLPNMSAHPFKLVSRTNEITAVYNK